MEQTDDETEVPPASAPPPAEPPMEPQPKRKPCNARLDELAKPNKRLLLALWETFAQKFSSERKENIRLLLQEVYAMTPEETEKYFEEINKFLKKVAARERFKKRLLKRYKARISRLDRKGAYRKFENLLKKGMMFAYKHSVPPLVSPRIRNMADVILEQLCDIRSIEMPERSDTEKQSQFLISFADWLAIAIEHIYYEIHVSKNRQLVEIEAEIKHQQELERLSKKSGRSSRRGSASTKKSQGNASSVAVSQM